MCPGGPLVAILQSTPGTKPFVCELRWDRAGATATCEFSCFSHTGQSVPHPLPKGSRLPQLFVLVSFEPPSCSFGLTLPAHRTPAAEINVQ